jgi:fatty acid desaturase
LTHWQAGLWVRHPADRLNAARALLAPVVLFAPFAIDLLQQYAIAYGIVPFVVIGDTNYLLHLHIHRPFSRSRILNLVFYLAMSAVTAMTASNWRIQHCTAITGAPTGHAGIADRIPQRHLKPFSWSWVLMPYHFYRSVTGRM